jgi:hypothetical protein
MATRAQHLSEAARNEVLAARLGDLGEWSWAVTVLFYASVHLIQAYLASSGSFPTSHSARESAIEHDNSLRPILRHYETLKKRSEAARYECIGMSADDFQNPQFRYGRLKGHMQRLT